MSVAPRTNVTQQLNYFRAAVSYSNPRLATAGLVPLGTLPAGAIVTGMLVKIITPFNAGTTNVLTIGTAADASAVLGDTDIDELEADTTVTFTGFGYYVTTNTPLFIKYAQTGTAASAGSAIIILFYVPNNDR